MRKIEDFIFILLSVCLLFFFLNNLFIFLEISEEDLFIPMTFKVNAMAIIVGVLVSGLAGSLFPFWSMEKYLRTQNIKQISRFKIEYKAKYFILMMGFLGLFFWCLSNNIFDVYWWNGLFYLFFSLSILISLLIMNIRYLKKQSGIYRLERSSRR
ncbi:MAG: hypothetical protein WC928_03725 [Patescibacteria group bacterium]|jgi:hypothetical protein